MLNAQLADHPAARRARGARHRAAAVSGRWRSAEPRRVQYAGSHRSTGRSVTFLMSSAGKIDAFFTSSTPVPGPNSDFDQTTATAAITRIAASVMILRMLHPPLRWMTGYGRL